MYNINFMDACHIKWKGKDIYKENIKQLKRAYYLRKTISKHSTTLTPVAGVMGITGMLTLNQMHKKRIEAAMKLCTSWDDYKRAFVHQLEQEA